MRRDDENYSRNLNGAFGIHPRCTALRSLYQAGDLSFVHAVGHPASARSRSHFDSMEYIELGTPGNQSTSTGWLTRHLQTAPNLPGNPLLQTLCASGSPPTSLLGRLNVATLASTSDFHPNSGTYEDTHLIALQQLYAGAGTLDAAMGHAVDTVQLLSSFDLDDYVPAGGAEYPNSGLGDDLAMIAQLIRLNLGLAGGHRGCGRLG